MSKNESRPKAAPVSRCDSQSIAPWRHDPHEPPSEEDRADLDVWVAAAERGFRLATRCTRCGQWVVAPSSVRAHMGPVCRAKVATASGVQR